MDTLKIAEVKGLQDVEVFWLCECDEVAAYSLDEAIAWYKKLTGLSDDDLYDYEEMEVISPDYKVQKSEEDTQLISVKEIVEKHWDGTPFIAVTTGGY